MDRISTYEVTTTSLWVAFKKNNNNLKKKKKTRITTITYKKV